jgi:hypothetical protein
MSDDSENSDDALIDETFHKYAVSGKMKKDMFLVLIQKLSKILPELKIEKGTPDAVFYLISDAGEIGLENFREWWRSYEKYIYFSGEKAKLLLKARSLYKKYAPLGLLDSENFIKLLEDLKIKGSERDFDDLDINNDGTIDFREFCLWLKWF